MKRDYLKHFDHVYIITLPWNAPRLTRLTRQLSEITADSKIEAVEAIPGNELVPSGWWSEGGGAWGCMLSHVKCLQDAWIKGYKRALILEDDAVLGENFKRDIGKFVRAVPKDWGQMYLGGCHLQRPLVEDGYLVGSNINRTHAYAVQREAIPKIHAHILYAPDYVTANGKDKTWHVDHHLGKAHEREDWKVVCPDWWMFGQGENDSNINGRSHPSYFWDWESNTDLSTSPIVLVTKTEDLKRVKAKLHFGWSLVKGSDRIDKMVKRCSDNPRTLKSCLNSITSEAFSMRRLPAVCVLNARQKKYLVDNYTCLTAEDNLDFFKNL
tara:strand:- start:22582 stop:23556 length:975 start_codon:yes stop_codon:yes gene_type:complete